MGNDEDQILHGDEAMAEIRQEADPVVRALLERLDALVVRAALEQRRLLPPSFDYLFFIATLREFFSEKDELRKVLDGKIDTWFDDE